MARPSLKTPPPAQKADIPVARQIILRFILNKKDEKNKMAKNKKGQKYILKREIMREKNRRKYRKEKHNKKDNT